jgi:hypothetical protein
MSKLKLELKYDNGTGRPESLVGLIVDTWCEAEQIVERDFGRDFRARGMYIWPADRPIKQFFFPINRQPS